MLFELTQGAPIACPPPPSREELIAGRQRRRQYESIWQARFERDVSAELIPFLHSSDSYWRLRAAKDLSRLESPLAEAPLQQALDSELQREIKYTPSFISYSPLRVALARIQSRNLKGKKRLEFVANSIGLSFREVAYLSYLVYGTNRRYYTRGSIAEHIIEDFIDLLYTMGKRGEDIQPLANRLTLPRPRQIELQAATMPQEQEINFLLDHLSQVNVINGDESNVAARVVSLGPRANQIMLQRLEKVVEHPEQYRGLEPYPGRPGSYRTRMGYEMLLSTAKLMVDEQGLPLLLHFKGHSNPQLNFMAVDAQRSIEGLYGG